jgi:hypothetical protein
VEREKMRMGEGGEMEENEDGKVEVEEGRRWISGRGRGKECVVVGK